MSRWYAFERTCWYAFKMTCVYTSSELPCVQYIFKMSDWCLSSELPRVPFRTARALSLIHISEPTRR
eukprot:1663078-Heterocapsa_arctica.AAC.1